MRHIAIVLVITVLVTVGVGYLLVSADLMPQVASEEGRLVDSLFDLQLWIISFIFSLILAIVLYSVVVFRRKPDEPDAEGAYIKGNTGLEVAWTAIPLVVVIVVATIGARGLADIISADDDELVVEVTGFQFGWRFDYPDYGITSNTLNLPKDRQVLLQLRSLDVIHSFWVPEFRLKQDAVPGMTTELRFTPTELGEYTLRCAELCGLSHAYMLAQVVVMEPADFEAWVSDAGEALTGEQAPEQVGARVVEVQCQSCHSVDGSDKVGPTFLNLYGAERRLDGGDVVTADEDYLREAIVNPGAQVVEGYSNIMPAVFGDTLSQEEIDGLIAYLQGLGRQ
jgi:cytochrome c oxidase subunit 2